MPPAARQPQGVVEKANHTAAQRWWRTLPDEVSAAEAQARLEVFCAAKTDTRRRVVDMVGTRATVAELAAAERLRPLPAVAFPATVTVGRTVRAQALVAFRGNRYSVPPELAGAKVGVTHRLGTATLDVVTASGTVLARHRRAPDGAGVTIRTDAHVTALERAALAAFDTARPHRRKQRIPPGPAARAAAAALSGGVAPAQVGPAAGRARSPRHDRGGPERLRRRRAAPPEPAITAVTAAGGRAGHGRAGARVSGAARHTWPP